MKKIRVINNNNIAINEKMRLDEMRNARLRS